MSNDNLSTFQLIKYVKVDGIENMDEKVKTMKTDNF